MLVGLGRKINSASIFCSLFSRHISCDYTVLVLCYKEKLDILCLLLSYMSCAVLNCDGTDKLSKKKTTDNSFVTSKNEAYGLFGWLIQPDSASHNSIFLSREISQPFSQQYFPLTRNQPASQPNKPSLQPRI